MVAELSLLEKTLNVPTAKQALSKTVTGQIIIIEKLTFALAEKVEDFYVEEIDTQYIESANLDSKILLQTKRDPHSFAIKELSLEKQKLDQLIKPHQKRNRILLNRIVNILIEPKSPRRHFEIILGTLLLNYPIDKADVNFKNRCAMSKVLRPIYQSALMSLLVEKLIEQGHTFKANYLTDLLSPFQGEDQNAQAAALLALQEILVEIIYLKEMGYWSPKSLEILSRTGENNLLSKQNRDELRAQSQICAREFHHYGVGALETEGLTEKPVPESANSARQADTQQQDQPAEVLQSERKAQMQQAARLAFIREIMDGNPDKPSEIEELLKVCQVYTSFMLSVKGTVDKELNIKAYDIMKSQADTQQLNSYFTEKLLLMMGRFPIGSGLYFIDLRRNASEFGTVDKAIVTGLNPRDPDEPVVKRVTTKYKYKLDSGTVRVPKIINLYYKEARAADTFTEKLKVRFQTQFKIDDNDLLYSFRANDAFRTLAISETKLW